MSGLALVVDRGARGPGASVELDRMLEALRHRGRDGADAWVAPPVALGHLHFWTTAEEAGERQPAADRSGRVRVALDGRLDNRADLVDALAPDADPTASDAALLALAYLRWGDRCVERLRGPFAFAAWDEARQSVLLGRDALGERPLFYSLGAGLLVAASEAPAVLGHPRVGGGLDPVTEARYFALQPPVPGATLYSRIRELPPGHCLRVDAGGGRLRRFWQPGVSGPLRLRSDEEYAERFRLLLEASVARCLRGSKPPAILLSGGVDSGSVTALAARRLARSGAGPLRAISWGFEELPACDERRATAPLVERYGIAWTTFPGDGHWPLSGADRFRCEATPAANPFAELLDRAYAEARAAGCSTVMTGWFSDDAYRGSGRWLADLAARGRISLALSEILDHLRSRRLGRLLAAARHLGAPALPGRALGDPAASPLERRWLTGRAIRLLDQTAAGSPGSGDAAAWRVAAVLTGPNRDFLDPEISRAHRAGVELRLPFWDRELVEFMLSIPADQLYRGGRHKHVLRVAMRDLLPEETRLAPKTAGLAALFHRGVFERRWREVRELLGGADARWRRYLRPAWLERLDREAARGEVSGLLGVLAWRCVGMELWLRQRC